MPKKKPLTRSQDVQSKLLGTGLRETPEDTRDYRLGAVYGVLDIKKVPHGNFNLSKPIGTEDQGPYDFCAAAMGVGMSAVQEGERLGLNWQFAMIKEILGDYESWGADLRTAILSLIKVGSIPKALEDNYIEAHWDEASDRDWRANWNSWPKEWKNIAAKYKKKSMFTVSGSYDAFDTVRAALWQHRADNSKVGLGVMWRYNWNNAVGGIIPLEAVGPGEGHALYAFDQVVKDGVQYLAIKNSWGDAVGDNGVFYASREVFNAYFGNYGFFMVKDLPKEVAKFLNENNLSIKSVWWVKILVFIRDLFTLNTQGASLR